MSQLCSEHAECFFCFALFFGLFFWFSWLRTRCALEVLWDSVFGVLWGRCGNLYLLLKSPLDRIVVRATQIIVLLRGTAKHLRLLILM